MYVVRNVVHVFKRFVAVVAMACLSSSRLCARVQDKLMCQFGHKVRRQTVFVKLKPPGPSPLRIFGKTCQVSYFLVTLFRINITLSSIVFLYESSCGGSDLLLKQGSEYYVTFHSCVVRVLFT